eukprot:730785-Hanusia_phi.AAC.2
MPPSALRSGGGSAEYSRCHGEKETADVTLLLAWSQGCQSPHPSSKVACMLALLSQTKLVGGAHILRTQLQP